MRQRIILCAILSSLTLVSYGQELDSVNSEQIICYVEVQPAFPGGLEALVNFVKKNLKRPKGTSEYVGRVYVGFVVAEDGSPTDFKIMRGLCAICDANAIETLKKMPKWIPGRLKGKPTRVRMILPIKYG